MEKERNVKASDWWSFLGINRGWFSMEKSSQAEQLFAALSCPQEFSSLSPCWKLWKSWQREWTEGKQLSQPEHHMCTPRDRAQTQVQMQIYSFLCCDVEPTSRDRRVWKDPSCAAPQTWPAGQGSVLMAELQSRYEAEVLWSRTSACYSVMLGLPEGMESKMLS